MSEKPNRLEATIDAIESGEATNPELLAHLAAQVGDGRLFKMEVDYAPQVDAALPKASQIAQTDTVGALESLSSLEKLTRLGSDMKSNARIIQHMVKLCFEAGKWDLLNETIINLSKKRLIIKLAIVKMVRDCCAMVEKAPDEKTRMQLIETLRTVTAGKIYVEVERARLTSLVVKKLETEGKTDEAATMLLELQVETYGSMEIKEKVEFLLEQMRLSVARRDFVRASIISRKISTRFFENQASEVQDLKLKYYELMIEIGLEEAAYLDVCFHYRAVFETPKVAAQPDKAKLALKSSILFAVLAVHSPEQWDALHRLAAIREVENIPDYKSLLDLFLNQELISWTHKIVAKYEKVLRRGTSHSQPPLVFNMTKEGDKRWADFHLRVSEHNMRMIAKYYTQISFERLAELLDYPQDEMETFVCNMIVSGGIADAKIHRPSRVVNLRARKADVQLLDHWAHNVHKLTDTLNKVAHLIMKEEMVHRHLERTTESAK